jgi:ArsR family transcriptional regulator
MVSLDKELGFSYHFAGCKNNEIEMVAGNPMKSIIAIFKALGERNRLRVFLALMETEELCVCEVGEFLGLAPATVSRHMSILRRAKLIDSQKRGKWLYYSIRKGVDPVLMQWIRQSVCDTPSLLEDRKRIEEIVRLHRQHGTCH